MLHEFFKVMFRAAERKPVQAAGRQKSLLMDGVRTEPERPTAEFLAQMLRTALAQTRAENRGGRTMHQTLNEPSPKSPSQDAEQPDGKIVKFIPRRRPETEQVPKPPPHDDDNDPGPSAA